VSLLFPPTEQAKTRTQAHYVVFVSSNTFYCVCTQVLSGRSVVFVLESWVTDSTADFCCFFCFFVRSSRRFRALCMCCAAVAVAAPPPVAVSTTSRATIRHLLANVLSIVFLNIAIVLRALTFQIFFSVRSNPRAM
jgi:hypothetical protein